MTTRKLGEMHFTSEKTTSVSILIVLWWISHFKHSNEINKLVCDKQILKRMKDRKY